MAFLISSRSPRVEDGKLSRATWIWLDCLYYLRPTHLGDYYWIRPITQAIRDEYPWAYIIAKFDPTFWNSSANNFPNCNQNWLYHFASNRNNRAEAHRNAAKVKTWGDGYQRLLEKAFSQKTLKYSSREFVFQEEEFSDWWGCVSGKRRNFHRSACDWKSYSSKESFDFEAKYIPGMTSEITPAENWIPRSGACRSNLHAVYEKRNCKRRGRIDYFLPKGNWLQSTLSKSNTVRSDRN